MFCAKPHGLYRMSPFREEQGLQRLWYTDAQKLNLGIICDQSLSGNVGNSNIFRFLSFFFDERTHPDISDKQKVGLAVYWTSVCVERGKVGIMPTVLGLLAWVFDGKILENVGEPQPREPFWTPNFKKLPHIPTVGGVGIYIDWCIYYSVKTSV